LTLEDEFNEFASVASTDQLKFMQDVQYYYECSNSAQKKKLERDDNRLQCIIEVNEMIIDNQSEYRELAEYDSEDDLENQLVSENQVEDTILNRFSVADQLFAETAMDIAEDIGIFEGCRHQFC
jgi:hypothetical protein